MRKIILAALLVAPFIFVDAARAEPKDKPAVHHVAKKKHKHHRRVKKAAVVEDKLNAFLRDCGIFGCSSSTYTSFKAPMDDMSAGEYWASEYQRNERQKKTAAKAPAKREEKTCGIFDSCSRSLSVYEEAKRWEGKTAYGNRQELKALLTEGNNNRPVDPSRIPWCAAFANAILNREGYSTTGSLAARSFLTLVHKTKDPVIGDIVVLKRGRSGYSGHVGFFEGYEEFDGVRYVKVFGGNTDKRVTTGWYPVKAVLGYRRVA